jgi:hypothetical protein
MNPALLSDIQDSLADVNTSMQMEIADFSKLLTLLKCTIDHLKKLKNFDSRWVLEAELTTSR